MSISAIALRETAEVQVQTRQEALSFANAALAARKHCGDPLRDYTPAERRRAGTILGLCREYYRLRTQGEMTRAAAALALRARTDLLGEFADGRLAMGARTLDHWLAQLGGDVATRRGPQDSQVFAVCRDYGAGAAKRILQTVLPDEFMDRFWEAYANQNSKLLAPSYRTALERCRREGIVEIPSEKQVRDWIATRINPRVLAKGRMSPNAFHDKLGGYVMRQWNCEVGACLVGDHRILDIWVRTQLADGTWIAMRPWVTAWMDVRSGFFLSAVIYDDAYPNHTKILEALYYAIQVNGGRPPLIVLTDNGKDYLKRGALQDARLQGDREPTRGRSRFRTLVEETFEPVVGEHSVAFELGITAETSRPYAGRQKPIERRFRDFAQDFDRDWPGFTGNSPATRPQYGQEYRGNPDTLPTCGQVVQAFREWLALYHSAPNESRITGGRAPAELWAERPVLREALSNEQLQWAMLVPHPRPLQVRRGPNPINVWLHGWPYRGDQPADELDLRQYWEQDIMVKTSWAPVATFEYSGRTLPMRAWAFTLDGAFICDLIAEEEITVWGSSPEKRERISRAMASQARIAKADREELAALRGRRTASFPARSLYPHGKGELPEAEGGGPAVVGSRVQGPGKGRARLVQDTGSGVAGGVQEPSMTAADTSDLAAWKRAQAEDDGDEVTTATVGEAPGGMAEYLRHRQTRGHDDE